MERTDGQAVDIVRHSVVLPIENRTNGPQEGIVCVPAVAPGKGHHSKDVHCIQGLPPLGWKRHDVFSALGKDHWEKEAVLGCPPRSEYREVEGVAPQPPS